MTTFELLTLLRDLGAAMATHQPRRTDSKAQLWSELQSRLETVLGRFEGEPHSAIAVARGKVAETSPFRIDADERIVEEVENGVWVRGWMRVDSQDIEAILALRIDKLGRAIEALSTIRQAVFLAHARDALLYDAIADRLGIALADVQRELAAALALIDAAVNED